MIEWLYRCSDLYIILFCIAVSLVAMFVVHAVCHKVVADKVPREGFKFAEAVHNSLISLCTLVLAFSLVQAIGNFRLVNTEVATEAAQINNLDRLLLRFNSPEANDVRQHLLAYAKSIVEDDWPALINAGSSEKTTALFKPISKGIIAIAPKNDRQVSLYSAALGLANDLERMRETRLESGTLRIPLSYWEVIIFAMFAKVLLSALLDRSGFGTYVLAIQMAVLGALLGLVFVYDEPYKGETSIKPDNFVSTIHKIESRVD